VVGRSLQRALFLLCVSAYAANAQSATRVRVDNDAFNFWLAPWDRPDEEYSSGVQLAVDWVGPAFWSKRLPHDALGCSAGRDRCISHTLTLGQDIYTGARSIREPAPSAGSRLDAGVLWIRETQRVARADRLDELSVTLGVTGEPALAGTTQRIVHGYAPDFQRPIDWSNQLPFEPVIGVDYDQRRLVKTGDVELQPHAGASVGNLLTEARAGIGARLGRNLREPFRPLSRADRLEVALSGDATVRAVARNEVLSGLLFSGAGPHVTLRTIVPEFQIGMSARYGAATLSYVVHQTGPEYTTRRGAHQWSTIQIDWQIAK